MRQTRRTARPGRTARPRRPVRRKHSVTQLLAATATACLAVACAGPQAARRPTPSYTDLLTVVRPVETRPGADRQDRFVVRDVSIDGRVRRALVVPVPSRVTWRLKIPAHGRLTGLLGLVPDGSDPAGARTVRLVGISDGRFYELLFEDKPGGPSGFARETWVPIRVDLSTYGEWKWSIFYQPQRRPWDLTATIYGTGVALAAWAELAVRAEP